VIGSHFHPIFLLYNDNMQILIVEDEEKIADFLKHGLVEERYAVDIAPDGEEALYKHDLNEYDLIILDLMIPKVDGLTVCRKIRSNNSNIPILMLTARDNIEDKIKGLYSGADDYMIKPFSFPSFLPGSGHFSGVGIRQIQSFWPLMIWCLIRQQKL
jgi:DNA-binding response OmpR family regulator